MNNQSHSATHPSAVRLVHERLLTDNQMVSSTVRTRDGAAVNVAESGTGPPVVFIHGSGSPGLFWLPLLRELKGMRAIVVDRPGFGLSDPVAAEGSNQDSAVGWIDRLLDALELHQAILVGHSMGGLWALHFALARPERVRGLSMIGAPSLPGTRAPLPYRLMGTPGVGALIARQPETPKSFHQFANMVGEGTTVGNHPDLVDLMVTVGNDRVARRALHREVRALLSPWALVSSTGFRRAAHVTETQLQKLAVPTLLIGGEHDPVGKADVARRLQALIPGAELELVEGGHAPWLGQAAQVAAALNTWVRKLTA